MSSLSFEQLIGIEKLVERKAKQFLELEKQTPEGGILEISKMEFILFTFYLLHISPQTMFMNEQLMQTLADEINTYINHFKIFVSFIAAAKDISILQGDYVIKEDIDYLYSKVKEIMEILKFPAESRSWFSDLIKKCAERLKEFRENRLVQEFTREVNKLAKMGSKFSQN